MVSFLRYLCVDNSQGQVMTKASLEGKRQQYEESMDMPTDLISSGIESYDTDQFSARSTPSTQRANFQAMLMDIKNSQNGKLEGWSLRKIHQYTNYLSDRLRKSKAFRGYFQIICRMVDVLRHHLSDMIQEGRQLPVKVDKEALIMTLMCVQALNKVYGRRSDVRASPHILVGKVAADFRAVSQNLVNSISSIDRSLQISAAEFIVPKDSCFLMAELKRELKLKVMIGENNTADKVKEGIVGILCAHRIRLCDFTQGDLVWLEREGMQQHQEESTPAPTLDSMQEVLQWVLHVVNPQLYPQPPLQLA